MAIVKNIRYELNEFAKIRRECRPRVAFVGAKSRLNDQNTLLGILALLLWLAKVSHGLLFG